MRGIPAPFPPSGDPGTAARRHEVTCGCGAAPSVRFEDGLQPPNLLDECLHRLEFLATKLSLLHLSYPVGIPLTQ
jgi:hypothetical protein